ncbi:M28 family peptidase [Gynurincola endophyticus]|jgi:hypothetical protein|uniref:M28 family peptidase n=1 Tax=Gynurincola endophyticus TaxID=2479004 RepID=UPI000F8E497D|nr:M28 family peptidase [Gynurincola endophyticus]
MKKSTLLLALSLAAFQATEAQKKIPNPTKYGKTITAEELKTHLYIVAGAEMEGRMTGSDGEKKAAAYLVSQFKSYGLQPGNNGSYFQPYHVYSDSVAKVGLSVNGVNLDNEINGNLTGYTVAFKSADLIYLGEGDAEKVKDINVRGRIVLITPKAEAPAANGQRRMPAYLRVAEDAKAKGAIAVLVATEEFKKENVQVSRVSGNAYKRMYTANSFQISNKAAAAILGTSDFASAKLGVVAARTDLNQTIENKAVVTNNVLAILEGSDKKDEYVFVTAHYDHDGKVGDVIWYGADDDGSGTVTLLELAQAFAQAKAEGKGPRRSIVFMAVSGEERGLLGSAYYGANPVYPLEKTTIDLNIDMIGRRDPDYKGDSTNYIYVVGDDKISSESRGISEANNKKYTKLELDYKFNDPKDPMQIYYRSDHYNFAKYGVPIIFYFSGLHPDYHRPTDTPDKIDYVQMAKRAQLIFYTAWEVANRNEMLKRDTPLDPSTNRR